MVLGTVSVPVIDLQRPASGGGKEVNPPPCITFSRAYSPAGE